MDNKLIIVIVLYWISLQHFPSVYACDILLDFVLVAASDVDHFHCIPFKVFSDFLRVKLHSPTNWSDSGIPTRLSWNHQIQ